ncbi:hypothetical protein B0H19DRAFT_1081450 [Mycena capillaripes]|nr:hypothetical protein B0H19DRAFT_1081450 [Mycena capillaripes]
MATKRNKNRRLSGQRRRAAMEMEDAAMEMVDAAIAGMDAAISCCAAAMSPGDAAVTRRGSADAAKYPSPRSSATTFQAQSLHRIANCQGGTGNHKCQEGYGDKVIRTLRFFRHQIHLMGLAVHILKSYPTDCMHHRIYTPADQVVGLRIGPAAFLWMANE